jgi:hypothetical protein
MRGLAVSLFVLGLAGCDSLPIMGEPQILVAPYGTVYQLHGQSAMASLQGGVPTPNGPHQLSDFGFNQHATDFGLRGEVGDGFAGLHLDWYHMEMESGHRAVLGFDWGALLTGDLVGLSTTMDELRLGYTYEVLRKRFDVRDAKGLELRLALATTLAQRKLVLHGREDTGLRIQDQHIQDRGQVFPGVHARLGYKDFALDAEYGFSPGLTFGGDYHGNQQDLEVKLSYLIPVQDVEFFAGYRRSDFNARGNDGGFAFDDHLVLDGYFFGARVSF